MLAAKNIKLKKAIAIILVITTSVLGMPASILIGSASAAINKAFNYQGKLMDSSGNAVSDASYDIKFTIYDASTGGNCAWTARGTCAAPTAKSITISSGLFSTMLGESGDNALPDFNSDEYWIGITVESDSEMTPRKRIGSVPQAMNADHVDSTGYIRINTATTTIPAITVQNGSGTDTFTIARDGNATTTASMDAVGFCISGADCIDAWSDLSAQAWEEIWDGVITPTTTAAGIFVTGSSTIDNNLKITDHLAVGGTFYDGYGFTVATTTYIEGQCVTGDTLLPILEQDTRYKIQDTNKSQITNSKTVLTRIDEIKSGEMVLSLNEKTGLLEPARINGLLDMGVKPIYKLTTESGKQIRTTGNHPYLARLPSPEDEANGGQVKTAQEELISPVVLAAEFNLGDTNGLVFNKKSGSVIADLETVSGWRQVLERFGKIQGIGCVDKKFQLLLNSLGDLNRQSYQVGASLFSNQEVKFHNDYIKPSFLLTSFKEYACPRATSCLADLTSCLSSSMYSDFNGSFSSILPISHQAGLIDLSVYSSSDNLSTKASSILDKTSKNAKVSKTKYLGAFSELYKIAACDFLSNLNQDFGTNLFHDSSLPVFNLGVNTGVNDLVVDDLSIDLEVNNNNNNYIKDDFELLVSDIFSCINFNDFDQVFSFDNVKNSNIVKSDMKTIASDIATEFFNIFMLERMKQQTHTFDFADNFVSSNFIKSPQIFNCLVSKLVCEHNYDEIKNSFSTSSALTQPSFASASAIIESYLACASGDSISLTHLLNSCFSNSKLDTNCLKTSINSLLLGSKTPTTDLSLINNGCDNDCIDLSVNNKQDNYIKDNSELSNTRPTSPSSELDSGQAQWTKVAYLSEGDEIAIPDDE
ncbi:MAG: hypothetical protein ABIJ91_02730, partial [Candidatus Kuenenbacteria bacterium]